MGLTMGTEPLSPYMVEAALLHYAGKEWGEPYWYEWFNQNRTGQEYDIPGLGSVKVVAVNLPKDISYAEHSETIWMVFDVQGTLYRMSGEHTSYDGPYMEDSMTIVKPVERTVIDYVEDAE